MSDRSTSLEPGPRKPGEVIDDFVQRYNVSKVQMAACLGTTKQNLNGMLSRHAILTEDRLRLIAKLAGADSEELLGPFREYKAWSETPEGIDYKIRLKQRTQAEEFAARRVHHLNQSDLKAAISTDLISIARLNAAGKRLGEIKFHGQFTLACHLDRVELDEDEASSASVPLEVTAGGTCIAYTEEHFRLSSYAALQFNGLTHSLCKARIRPCCNTISEFTGRECFSLRMDNLSDKPVPLTRGMEIASVVILWNPDTASFASQINSPINGTTQNNNRHISP